jgi:hypothetical protein
MMVALPLFPYQYVNYMEKTIKLSGASVSPEICEALPR